jgi:hypothetical protein
MTDASTTPWNYALLPAVGLHGQADPWSEVRAILDREGPGETYWSIRAFSLEGHFELGLDPPGRLSWGGPLMDLACALQEWVVTDTDLRFIPAEHAASITTRQNGATVDFYVNGHFVGVGRQADVKARLAAFLAAIADDVCRHEPRTAGVAGLEWLAARSSSCSQP